MTPGADRPRPAQKAKPGVFLVAHRELTGSGFAQSVVLLLRHNERGTLGVIINRRTPFHLHDLLPELDRKQAAQHAVFIGGPVAPHTLVLLMRGEKPAPGIEKVTEEISFSAEREVLESLIDRHKSANDLRLYIGFAGWAAGQLEAEIARDAWFLIQATADAVFGIDEEDLWERFIDKLDPPGIRVRFDPRPRTGTPPVAVALAALLADGAGER